LKYLNITKLKDKNADKEEIQIIKKPPSPEEIHVLGKNLESAKNKDINEVKEISQTPERHPKQLKKICVQDLLLRTDKKSPFEMKMSNMSEVYK